MGAGGVLIDWSVFCRLTGTRRGWPPIGASVASTSCAMTWTFTANCFLVFQPNDPEVGLRVARFLAVTCFSGWVLQSGTLRLVAALAARLIRSGNRWLPARRWFRRVEAGSFSRKTAKLTAIGVGFLWNFLWYRNWVFAG